MQLRDLRGKNTVRITAEVLSPFNTTFARGCAACLVILQYRVITNGYARHQPYASVFEIEGRLMTQSEHHTVEVLRLTFMHYSYCGNSGYRGPLTLNIPGLVTTRQLIITHKLAPL